MISEFPQPQRLPHPVRITEQVWPEGTVPVVSVRCITYQHVNFIREAIEGFLMQETTFPVEILIHDDASTDGTADIVREYQAKYPQLIRTVLQTENQHSQGKKFAKFLDPLLRGEFIALCEGDDYWTSPHKLQKQVEVLQRRPGATLCFHGVKEVNEKGITLKEIHQEAPQDAPPTLRELLARSFIPTCSSLFRRNALGTAWQPPNTKMGDWPLWVYLASHGEMVFLPETWGCYRRHSGGVWSGLSRAMHCKHIAGFYRWASMFLATSKVRDREHLVSQAVNLRQKYEQGYCLCLLTSKGWFGAVVFAWTRPFAYLWRSPRASWKAAKLALRITSGIYGEPLRRQLEDLKSGPATA